MTRRRRRQLFRELRKASPPDTVLVEESPSNLADLHAEWPVTKPDSFYTFASGALGWDLPAAVGLTLAERDSGRNRPVLAVIGDGSMQYSVQALYTAVQQELPLVVVVPTNGEYAILKAFGVLEKSPNVPGLDIPGSNRRHWRRAAGDRRRRRYRRAGQGGTRRCLGALGPTLIEVPIDPAIPDLT